MDLWTRRKFFSTTLAGSAIAGTTRLFGKSLPVDATPLSASTAKRPVIISSANGLHALAKGMDVLKSGGDTLDAAVAAVTVVEDDPNDDSVGYGGLPNEECGLRAAHQERRPPCENGDGAHQSRHDCR
jgi:N4-(beta-N-acetylglucosaminyl)-L-asparaginase